MTHLKRVIVRSGLKQTYLAAKCGLLPSALSRKINGSRGLTQEEKERLAKILAKRPNELFPGN